MEIENKSNGASSAERRHTPAKKIETRKLYALLIPIQILDFIPRTKPYLIFFKSPIGQLNQLLNILVHIFKIMAPGPWVNHSREKDVPSLVFHFYRQKTALTL